MQFSKEGYEMFIAGNDFVNFDNEIDDNFNDDYNDENDYEDEYKEQEKWSDEYVPSDLDFINDIVLVGLL